MAATLPLPTVNGTNNGAAAATAVTATTAAAAPAPALPSPAASPANATTSTVGGSVTTTPAAAAPAVAPASLPLRIVSLAVTYVPHHNDETFRRFARLPAPAYLWAQYSNDVRYQAITEIRILYDGERVEGSDWERVDDDINKGLTGRSAFLAYRRAPDGIAIIELKTLGKSEKPQSGDGYVKMDRDLSRDPSSTSEKLFLAYKPQPSASDKRKEGVEIGDFLDVMDTVNKWCVARVTDVKGKDLCVHFEGWSDKYDEVIAADSKRLAPFRTHTRGADTGPGGNANAFKMRDTELANFQRVAARTQGIHVRLMAILAGEIKSGVAPKYPAPTVSTTPSNGAAATPTAVDPRAKLETRMAGELSHEEWTFLLQENIPFVSNCLNAVIDQAEVVTQVNTFLQQNLDIATCCIKWDDDIPNEIMSCVYRIFNGDKDLQRFYSKYGCLGTEKKVDGKYAIRPKPVKKGNETSHTSSFLIANLNHFGNQGGFDAIQKRMITLCDPPPNVPCGDVKVEVKAGATPVSHISDRLTTIPLFNAIRLLVKVMGMAKVYLEPKIGKPLVQRISDVALQRLRNQTDDDVKILDREAINDLLRDLESLMLKYLKPADVAKAIERTMLHMVLRLLTCKFLDKRIQGANDMNEIVERVRSKENEKKNRGKGGTPRPPTLYLTAKHMKAWVEENKIVDHLLGKGSHHALIAKSPTLLKFLAQHDSLSSAQLALLWSSSTGGKHETLVRVVYDSVADIAQDLPASQLDTLFAQIANMPLSQYTDVLMGFLRVFTCNAVKQTPRANKWYGLETFWLLIQDGTVSTELQEQAHRILIELLSLHIFEARRVFYLEKCINGLSAGASVMSVLRLARHIFDMFPKTGPSAIDQVIAALDRKYNLMTMILADFTRYSAIARKTVPITGSGSAPPSPNPGVAPSSSATAAAPGTAALPAPSSTPSNGGVGQAQLPSAPSTPTMATTTLAPPASTVHKVPSGNSLAAQAAKANNGMEEKDGKEVDPLGVHYRELDTRLAFMDYVVTGSVLMLTKEHVDKLWEVFVVNGVSDGDRARILRWLEKSLPLDKKVYVAFSDDIVRYIFTSLLCNTSKLDYSSLSAEGYSCFEAYFCFVNHLEGCLAHNTKRYFTVANFSKLIGMSSLWSIVCESRDSRVGPVAREFLINAHMRLAESLEKKDIFKAFVERCMAAMMSAGQSIEKGIDVFIHSVAIKQLVGLMELFLVLCDKQEDDESPDKLYYPQGSFRIDVVIADRAGKKQGPPIVVTLTPEDKLGLMRRDLAKYIEFPETQLKFVYKNRVLYPDEYDQSSIREARITHPNPVVYAFKMDPTDIITRPAGESKADNLLPRHLLANNETYFQLLFDLLKHGGDVADRVWKLLIRLPTNEAMANHIRGFDLRTPQDKPDWPRLIDPSSILRLLYSLNIVDSMIYVNDKTSPQQRAAINNWSTLFINQGGFQHLYTILMGMDLRAAFADALPQQCLSVTIKLVNHFLYLRDGTFMRYPDLLPRLYIIFDACVRVPGSKERKDDGTIATVNSQGAGSDAIIAELLRGNLDLIIAVILRQPALLDVLHGFSRWERDVVSGLLRHPSQKIRHCVANGLNHLCLLFDQHVPADKVRIAPRNALLPLLVRALPHVDKLPAEQTDHYFALTKALIQSYRPPPPRNNGTPAPASSTLSVPSTTSVNILDPSPPATPTSGSDQSTSSMTTSSTGSTASTASTSSESVSSSSSVSSDDSSVTSSTTTSMSINVSTASTSSSVAPSSSTIVPPVDDSAISTPIGFDFMSLVTVLTEKIKTHPVIELRSTEYDAVLCGLLELAREVIVKVPVLKPVLGSRKQLDLLHHVFTECLFDVPSTANRDTQPPPKCKSVRCRRAAFALLAELSRGCMDNYRALLNMLTPNHAVPNSERDVPLDWTYEAKNEEKSETGYVGLKNLGCICYMNSLMQQMFMIPQLRGNIMEVEDSEPDKKESYLYQMQCIMAALQESDKQFTNPHGFCWALKDYEGNRTNPSIQMDSQEFLNMLFDRVDTQLKNTPYQNTLSNVLGGLFSNDMIPKDCPHRREREEPFYVVSLNVKHRKTLEESLKNFVEGEWLEGDNSFMCQTCKKKKDTLRRICLKRLPPTIAFHLKRFEFNYDTRQKSKLNARLEFPTTLNLKAYTKEGLLAAEHAERDLRRANLAKNKADGKEGKAGGTVDARDEAPIEVPVFQPDDYYEYVLSGVLIHTGGADRGHYYSFVKERLTKEEKAAGRHAKWFEFNDTTVRKFDPNNIAEECFGGEDPKGAGGSADKCKNAYMIFYDRVIREEKDDTPDEPEFEQAEEHDWEPVHLDDPRGASHEDKKGDNKEEAPSANGDISAHPLTRATSLGLSNTPQKPRPKQTVAARVTIPAPIFNRVWNSNVQYWKDRALFDPEYFSFMRDVIEILRPPDLQPLGKEGPLLVVQLTQLATRFLLETYARAAKKDQLPVWFQSLQNLFSHSIPACGWMMDSISRDNGWSYDFLLQCPDVNVRRPFAGLVCHILGLTVPGEMKQWQDNAIVNDERSKSQNGAVATSSTAVVATGKTESKLAVDTTYTAPDNHSARFGDTLVRYLNLAPAHWKRFDQYLRVISYYSSLTVFHATHLIKRHALTRMIDMYLGDTSPQPWIGAELVKDEKGKRIKMVDGWAPADWTFGIEAMSTMICSVLTPNNVAAAKPSPTLLTNRDATNAVISSLDWSLITSNQFLSHVMLEATSRKRGKSVSNLLIHICWENEALTQTVIGLICAGMEEYEYDKIRPYYRVLSSLLAMKDSLVTKRLEWILTSLLAVMAQQQRFWKITDYCIEHLIRLARRHAHVYRWLFQHGSKLDFVLNWLFLYPVCARDGSVVMNKPNYKVSEYAQRDPLAFSHTGAQPARKKQILDDIKEGKPVDMVESDSDHDLADRVFERGQAIDCKDTVQKWCTARVVNINNIDQRVEIQYDGWGPRWNEWIEISSPRLADYGRYTTQQRAAAAAAAAPVPAATTNGHQQAAAPSPSPAAVPATAAATNQPQQNGSDAPSVNVVTPSPSPSPTPSPTNNSTLAVPHDVPSSRTPSPAPTPVPVPVPAAATASVTGTLPAPSALPSTAASLPSSLSSSDNLVAPLPSPSAAVTTPAPPAAAPAPLPAPLPLPVFDVSK